MSSPIESSPPPPPPIEKQEGEGEAQKNDDIDDNSLADQSPVAFTMTPPPIVRFRPSFVTNREFVPSLLVYGTFVFLVHGVQWLGGRCAFCGFVGALVVLAFMCEWERRARYSFGRVRQRAHFDPLNLVKLPTPHYRPDVEMEPPTPWIPQNEEMTRTDPIALLKRARETVGGGGGSSSGGGAQSAMELALLNLLKKAAVNSNVEDKDKVATAEQPPPT